MIIKGETKASSHSASISFDEALIRRASDGTINLPITITRSASGIEKWYFSTQLVKTFYNLPTENTAESEVLKFAAADGWTTEFKGELDMISLWNKELSLAEVTELISKYDPTNHSAYAECAVNVWPIGEDLISSNGSGTIIYDIKDNLHGSTINMTRDNFIVVDLTEFDAIDIATYPTLTNIVLNATDASPLANATIKLTGANDSFTTTTDTNGSFTFSNIPMRSYTLEVSLEGYVSYSTTFDADATNAISLSPETEGAGLNDLRFVLSWNELPRDMDIFFKIFDAESNLLSTIYFNNRSYVEGEFEVNLDNDETRGYGPETITVSKLPEKLHSASIHLQLFPR